MIDVAVRQAQGDVIDEPVVVRQAAEQIDDEALELSADDVQYVALWSRDGSTWEYKTLDELAGQRISGVTEPSSTALATRWVSWRPI